MIERQPLYAVIPAGGSGTRLWPASRAKRPKFLLPLPGPRSMIQATLDRLAPIVAPEDIYVLTGREHAVAVARQLPDLPEENIVVEPMARGSGPAIGMGAALIARRDPDAIMGSFAADHHITDPDAFRRAVMVAMEVAKQDYLVTVGIEPRAPVTGYGYIRQGESILERDGLHAYQVEQFKEKPDLATATRYVESGEYFWNASIFVWRAQALLDAMRQYTPDVFELLMAIAEDWDSSTRSDTLDRLWPRLRDVTIDHGIMEHSDRVAVVPIECGWTDLGDWDSLGDVLATSPGENIFLGGRHIAEDTVGTLVFGNNRLVATLGVENLVIVDTDDIVLVCERSRSQDVRRIVERLRGSGATEAI
jgi:mannose-1-phosphate guanylyltransferase